MSARDEATLSAAERAALAGLESKAEADDPRLAAQLRGGLRRRPAPRVPAGLVRASQTWAGPMTAVVGLAMMVLGLSSLLVVSLLGVALLVAGLAMTATLVRRRLGASVQVLPGQQSHDQDHGEGLTNA